MSKADNVNHPSYYQSCTGLEVIDVIESFDLDFHAGNVVKYTLRAKKKGKYLEDLKKARWYLDRLIEINSKPRQRKRRD